MERTFELSDIELSLVNGGSLLSEAAAWLAEQAAEALRELMTPQV